MIEKIWPFMPFIYGLTAVCGTINACLAKDKIGFWLSAGFAFLQLVLLFSSCMEKSIKDRISANKGN